MTAPEPMKAEPGASQLVGLSLGGYVYTIMEGGTPRPATLMEALEMEMNHGKVDQARVIFEEWARKEAAADA